MGDLDAQKVTHSGAPRPSVPSQHLGTPRTSTSRASSNQGKGASLPTSRSQISGSARPPSGGISAWEDDSTQQGADLLAFLGKADSGSSGGTTPRNTSGPISGDGNLAQALIAARKAAELERGSSGGGSATGDPLEPSSARQSHSGMAASSSGGEIRRSGTGAASDAGRSPLSRASGGGTAEASREEPMEQGHDQPDAADGFAERKAGLDLGVEDDEAAAYEEDSSADDTMLAAAGDLDEGPAGVLPAEEESTITSWSPHAGTKPAGGGGGGVEGGGQDLRGLLYSDDEGGDDDDDYQDLMTADDDALFGGTGAGGGGAGGSKKSRGVGRQEEDLLEDAEEDMEGDEEGGQSISVSSSGSAAAAKAAATSGGLADMRQLEEAAAVAGGSTNRRETLSALADGTAATGGGGLPAGKGAGSKGSWDGARNAWGSECGGPLEEAAAAQSSQPQEHFIQDAGPVHAAPVEAQALQASFLGLPDAAAGQVGVPRTSGPGGYTSPAAGFDARVGQSQFSGSPPAIQQSHYAAIPTAQVGEGLRLHPPAGRRQYVPGQSNRSPVRGSGYVVSPAAVRPASPPTNMPRLTHVTAHYHTHAGGARRASSTAFSPMAVTAVQLGRPRSPRDSQTSAGGGNAPIPQDGDVFFEASGFPAGLGLTGTVPPQQLGAMMFGQPTPGGGGKAGSWSALSPGQGPGGVMAPSGPFGRFPPAAVQHLAGGQVYRSMPISQVAGSPSDEMAAVAAAAGGGGGQAAGRNSNSPGRLSGRGGRVRASPGGALLGHLRDRYGSSSAPARPTTSPLRSPRGNSSRSPKRSSATGPLAPVAATAVFGNGVLAGYPPDGYPEERLMTAPAAAASGGASRAMAVPSLPQYGAPTGIRHCGFKQGPGSVVGSGGVVAGQPLYGSSFAATRQKAADERMRSTMVAKIVASVAAKEQQSFAGAVQVQHDFSAMSLLPQAQQQPSGGEPAAYDSGGHLHGAADGWAVPHGATFAEPSSHVQRRGSLPHLLAASYQAAEHGAAGAGHGPFHAHPANPHIKVNQALAPTPAFGLLGHVALGAGRSSTQYDSALPAVQSSQVVPSVRSFTLDVSRRAISRA